MPEPVKTRTAGPLAQSLAQMIIEWVDGTNGQDWQLGLPSIIQKRIDRFEGANTSSHEAMKEALRDARDRIEELRDPSINGVWNDALKRKIDAALSSVEDTQS